MALFEQIVLITGASSGIGEACARVFAQAGAKLILAARRQERLDQLAAELSKSADHIHLLPLDVCDRVAVESSISALPAAWSDQAYRGLTPLTPADVADVIFFCVTRPPHVNISEVLFMPSDQAGATLFNRQA